MARLRDLTGDAWKHVMIDSGHAMPRWPKPLGRDAAAIEQLVIEQDFGSAGSSGPAWASPAGSSWS